MTVTVVGSIAFDTIHTPAGARDRVVGGAATHFAVAASYFTDVRMVGVVGDDFGPDEFAVLSARGINTDDVRRIAGAESFHWSGRYEDDMAVAHTLDTRLNVFADFDPELSAGARAAPVLFLANIQPHLQQRVREQSRARLVGLDSMNYWIESARDALIETIRLVDVVVLNDAEVRMLTKNPNLARAARDIRSLGPRVLLVKQGAYGACMYTEQGFFSVPAYPLETVIDPTGAGDAFAGGFFGYLDALGGVGFEHDDLCLATVYGSVMASLIVEDFGGARLHHVSARDIRERFSAFKRITRFSSRRSLPLRRASGTGRLPRRSPPAPTR